MFIFLLGTCLGSFLCVVAQRLPVNQSFVYSRSKCDHCQQILRAWELIPLVSSLYFRFQCQRCGQKFSSLLFWAELGYGLLLVFCLAQPTLTTKLIALVWLTTSFLLSLTDVFYLIVEPKILYPGHLLLGVLCLYTGHAFHWDTLVFLLIISLIYLFILKNGLGLGDLLLLLGWAPWLTAHQFSLLLLVASLSALISFGFFYVRKKPIRQLPFVPFLSLGVLVVYFL